MLKQGLKNYFKNLKHFFTPMGTMFLGLVFGLSVFFPVLISAFKDLAADVNALSQEFNVDFNQLFKSLFYSVSSLNWSDPFQAVNTILSDGWLENTVCKSLEALLGIDYQTFIEEIDMIIALFTSKVFVGIGVLIVFFVLGIIGGYYLTAFLVRRSIARRAWWKIFLAYLIDFVVNAALVVLGVWLALLWKYSTVIFIFVAFVLSGVVSLLSAYILQGYKKVPLQQVVNFKNAVQFMLSALIVWLITFALCAIVKVLTNDLVTVVVAIALMEIAVPVNKLNAEAYVKQLVDNKQISDASAQEQPSSEQGAPLQSENDTTQQNNAGGFDTQLETFDTLSESVKQSSAKSEGLPDNATDAPKADDGSTTDN